MKRSHSSIYPFSPGLARQKPGRTLSSGEAGAWDAGRRPRPARAPRYPGALLSSGLLIIGLLAVAMVAVPALSPAASVSVGISVTVGPPPIPVYTQPVCPGPGYMWTPGYWAHDPDRGYFWVPGTWVVAPAPGLLWTPGYWGWGGVAFVWHAGYWGPHVGFYGGINYGFGYTGVGFVGGEWRGRDFYYNRSVTNVNVTRITNVYNRTVVNNYAVNRVSYNGGAGGLRARPNAYERDAERDRHLEATPMQRSQERGARNERAQFASENHGRPEFAATGRPGEFRREGDAAGPGGYHEANPGHGNAYYAAHGPTPAGGGNRAVMAAHPPASQNFGGRHDAGAGPQSRNSQGPKPHAESHQRAVEQHNSKPSGGGHGDEHKSHR